MPTAEDKYAGVCVGGINAYISRPYRFMAYTDTCSKNTSEECSGRVFAHP